MAADMKVSSEPCAKSNVSIVSIKHKAFYNVQRVHTRSRKKLQRLKFAVCCNNGMRVSFFSCFYKFTINAKYAFFFCFLYASFSKKKYISACCALKRGYLFYLLDITYYDVFSVYFISPLDTKKTSGVKKCHRLCFWH